MNSKIFKNASWIIICRIFQSILSLLVTMLTARYLGPSNYGVINYAAAIVAFVAPIAQLGLGSIQVQELVDRAEEEGTIIGTTLCMSLASATMCTAGVIAFSTISNRDDVEVVIVCALYSIVLFFQSAELLQFWFQAKYLSKYSAVVSLVAFAVISAYKIFLLIKGLNVYWFAVSNSIDYIIISFALLILYKKLGGKKLQFSISVGKRMLAKSKYYIIANMMVVVFSQTDRIMLQQMLNSAATGLYSAAATCAGMVNFVYTAIIDSFRPMIFENHKHSSKAFQKSVTQLYAVIIYLSLCECIVVTFFAKFIIRLIYGAQYVEAASALMIVAWYTMFSYIGSVRNVWILAENKQKWIWKINLFGALANVVVNYFLIPIWGINGAAVASLVTQIFANVIISYLIKDIRESSRLMVKALNPKNIVSLVATIAR